MAIDDLKAELQAKHDAIKAAAIPEVVAGVLPTNGIRDARDAYCASLQAYINSLGLPEAQTEEDICSRTGRHSELSYESAQPLHPSAQIAPRPG